MRRASECVCECMGVCVFARICVRGCVRCTNPAVLVAPALPLIYADFPISVGVVQDGNEKVDIH